MLDSRLHAGLRMRRPTAEGRHFVQVVPAEFDSIAARCPLLLTKSPDTGQFYFGAVFGFTAGENLLIDESGALDAAMPLDLVREGFFVGDGAVVIDRDHPRFVSDRGVALFDENGAPTDGLREAQRALALMDAGLRQSEALIQRLLALRLVEQIDINLAFDSGEAITLEGLYTISRDALAALDPGEIATLFETGALQSIYALLGSLSQIGLLAQRRNRRL
ncbi:SapC family protein [Sphingomonas morindae]|uniref:SapC family protein n=1 Tax=Sphingomonas morindae TaxID=1541170 RepID=A0ABY4XCZ8_9SPHN|nr:SapC family protein [Sphingomonas morindae]USI74621.1 SapC family protein [Sphingomonas morindae]